MKNVTKGLVMVACLLLTSCAHGTLSRKGPVSSAEVNAPEVCSRDAFIQLAEYELPPVPRDPDPAKQAQLLNEWKDNAILKYPSLMLSYGLLLECWEEYHPETTKK